jgi:hypothetical protein
MTRSPRTLRHTVRRPHFAPHFSPPTLCATLCATRSRDDGLRVHRKLCAALGRCRPHRVYRLDRCDGLHVHVQRGAAPEGGCVVHGEGGHGDAHRRRVRVERRVVGRRALGRPLHRAHSRRRCVFVSPPCHLPSTFLSSCATSPPPSVFVFRILNQYSRAGCFFDRVDRWPSKIGHSKALDELYLAGSSD